MTRDSFTRPVDLVTETCCNCHMVFAMPRSFYDQLQRSKPRGSFFCPAGHSMHYLGDSEETKLRRERDRLKQEQAYLEEQARKAREQAKHERHRANAYKGHATRITKRAKAGMCPCCNRTFAALYDHMRNEHPDFTPLDEEPTDAKTD